MRTFARWPTLLAALVLLTAALGVDLSSSEGQGLIVLALLALAATCLGAFLYAEGARHRDWRDTPPDDDATVGPDE